MPLSRERLFIAFRRFVIIPKPASELVSAAIIMKKKLEKSLTVKKKIVGEKKKLPEEKKDYK